MKLLKDSRKDIIKLYINQVGITVFSLLLYISVSFLGDEALKLRLKVLISVVSTVFYLILLYMTVWDFGVKSRLVSDTTNLTLSKKRGITIALMANLPSIFFSAFSLIAVLIYNATAGIFWKILFIILNFPLRVGTAMYLGMLQGMFSFIENQYQAYIFESLGFLVMSVLSFSVAYFGYAMGVRKKHLFTCIRLKSRNHDR